MPLKCLARCAGGRRHVGSDCVGWPRRGGGLGKLKFWWGSAGKGSDADGKNLVPHGCAGKLGGWGGAGERSDVKRGDWNQNCANLSNPMREQCMAKGICIISPSACPPGACWRELLTIWAREKGPWGAVKKVCGATGGNSCRILRKVLPQMVGDSAVLGVICLKLVPVHPPPRHRAAAPPAGAISKVKACWHAEWHSA